MDSIEDIETNAPQTGKICSVCDRLESNHTDIERETCRQRKMSKEICRNCRRPYSEHDDLNQCPEDD